MLKFYCIILSLIKLFICGFYLNFRIEKGYETRCISRELHVCVNKCLLAKLCRFTVLCPSSAYGNVLCLILTEFQLNPRWS